MPMPAYSWKILIFRISLNMNTLEFWKWLYAPNSHDTQAWKINVYSKLRVENGKLRQSILILTDWDKLTGGYILCITCTHLYFIKFTRLALPIHVDMLLCIHFLTIQASFVWLYFVAPNYEKMWDSFLY